MKTIALFIDTVALGNNTPTQIVMLADNEASDKQLEALLENRFTDQFLLIQLPQRTREFEYMAGYAQAKIEAHFDTQVDDYVVQIINDPKLREYALAVVPGDAQQYVVQANHDQAQEFSFHTFQQALNEAYQLSLRDHIYAVDIIPMNGLDTVGDRMEYYYDEAGEGKAFEADNDQRDRARDLVVALAHSEPGRRLGVNPGDIEVQEVGSEYLVTIGQWFREYSGSLLGPWPALVAKLATHN